ncbi:MAG: pyridoxamine 5'-phosphate oxidase family protein [Halobacteria archaeon]|nr:pyridoxamine 5'-phosphate oxidase family protein [Halobacteria archaeon]
MSVQNELSPELAAWITAQPVFFNATAPLSAEGHINLSPRGLDSLRIVDPEQIVILDFTGSGNETAAHMTENGRITLMFCAFEDKPRVLRVYGRGEVIRSHHPDWSNLRALFSPGLAGVRQIFRIRVTQVKTSCGFGVPLMQFVAQRDDLLQWAEKKGADGLERFQQKHNLRSIDDLPTPQ